jgi:hypothetical protein
MIEPAQHESGTDDIDQVSFERYEPGLQGDKQGKGPLNSNQTNVQMGLYGLGEQSPRILQVGDRHHGNDASH